MKSYSTGGFMLRENQHCEDTIGSSSYQGRGGSLVSVVFVEKPKDNVLLLRWRDGEEQAMAAAMCRRVIAYRPNEAHHAQRVVRLGPTQRSERESQSSFWILMSL